MCGICGQFNHASGKPVEESCIRAMAHAILHRGPDDEGFYFDGPVGLGFRRLSIIDLSGGHQPMCDTRRRVWVIFNGEIYNFQALRSELEGLGYQFQTHSDTEVIVHGYCAWKKEVFNRLNGMFAIAIWDQDTQELIVARDPMGIKCVYFEVENGVLRFASEVRSLLTQRDRAVEADPVALNLFLRYRYTPSPLTAFKGIQKLAPGCRLVASATGGVKVERWWLAKPRPLDPVPGIREAEEHLLDLYRDAVKRQMISDVPLGLLLSGGVDSGLLLGLMCEQTRKPQTYSVGYGSSYRGDELEDAAETARLFSAENTAILLDREAFDQALAHVVQVLEEPIASASVVPMYHVCEAARKGVTVALMGQGPDEMFGGYARHLGVRYGAAWRKIPTPLRSLLKSLLAQLPRNETVQRSLYSLDVPDRMNRYKEIFSLLPAGRIDGLFHPGILPENPGDRVLQFWGDLEPLMSDLDELGGFQFIELRSSLPDELLMYADKLSMAHSLEVRVPYLDLEIVRFVESLPPEYKVRWGQRKWLHKRVCGNLLPQAILDRKKRGFAASVVDSWYRASLSGKIGDTVNNPQARIYQYLRPEAVRQLVEEHQSGKQNNYKVLFSIVLMEQWLQQFV